MCMVFLQTFQNINTNTINLFTYNATYNAPDIAVVRKIVMHTEEIDLSFIPNNYKNGHKSWLPDKISNFYINLSV